jgi:hypothetical protein
MVDYCQLCGEPSFELVEVRISHDQTARLCSECERLILDDGMVPDE